MKKQYKFLISFFVEIEIFFFSNKIYLKFFDKIYIIILPFFFYIKKINNGFSFLFNSKYLYKTFLSNILNVFFKYRVVYYFRLRLKGLGFKIRKYMKDLYRFFFGLKHFFYLYVPIGLIFKLRRRKFIVLSDDLVKLNNFFNQLLFLKKMDFYEKNNTFIRPSKIMYIKKRK